MKILICISHVPDTTTKIQFNAEGTELNKAGVTFIINPYDEFAISRALELKEAGKPIEQITVLCVGGAEVEATLRKALSLGVTDAVRIDAEARDAYYVANQIAAYAKDKGYDLVAGGKESIDSNGSAVLGMVAELIDAPYVSFATELDVNGSIIKFKREIDGGMEVLESPTPVVFGAQKGMAEWRIPNMKGIAEARRKQIAVVPPVAAEALTASVRFELPPAKAGCQYIQPDDMASVVKLLQDKGVL
jgi:electron transfer flavoprotein beta subunit